MFINNKEGLKIRLFDEEVISAFSGIFEDHETVGMLEKLGVIILEEDEYKKIKDYVLFNNIEGGVLLLPTKYYEFSNSEYLGRYLTKMPDHSVFSKKLGVISLRETLEEFGFMVIDKNSQLDHKVRPLFCHSRFDYDNGFMVLCPKFSVCGSPRKLLKKSLVSIKKKTGIENNFILRKSLKYYVSFFDQCECSQIIESGLKFYDGKSVIIFPNNWDLIDASVSVGKSFIVDEYGRQRFELIFSKYWPHELKVISPLRRIRISRNAFEYKNGIAVAQAAFQDINISCGDGWRIICATLPIYANDEQDLICAYSKAEKSIERILERKYPDWRNYDAYWDENDLLGQ